MNQEQLEDYFLSIMEEIDIEHINKAKELFRNLTLNQVEKFKEWWHVYAYYDALDNETTTEVELINLLKLLEHV